MRLNKIKISGFKSFVDPTTITFPTNLIGIVGPNGCGKSNTIDAVRWVMGESSAKHLRGASMSDVIFNGSTSRKPVGQASIELIFDNSDKSAGGQYSAYNEISVRRTMTRDGQSNYYLNGSKCRKRDITDLFLGTGLGPRSYAIIEQGMISRIIEAKPEELRVYIEEAAGISKYKERRRETENRLKQTRENLSRLTDLRDEVEKQIEKLKRQARTAERYKKLKQEERETKSQLLVVKLRKIEIDLKEIESEISKRQIELESIIANQRAAEKSLEKTRDEYVSQTDEFNEVQGNFYRLGSEIAKVEQTIQHRKSMKQRHQDDIAQVTATLTNLQQQKEDELTQLEESKEKQLELEPGFEEFKEKENIANEQLNFVNEQWQEWQTQWDQFNREASEPVREAQSERFKIDHIEKQVNQAKQKLERLFIEKQNISCDDLEKEIEELIEQEMIMSEKQEEFKGQLEQCVEEISSNRKQNRDKALELDELQKELHQQRGKLASLEAIQQAALGKDDSSISDWLSENGFAENQRLAELISIESGWETAIEVVLGKTVEALCIDQVTEDIGDKVSALENGVVTFIEQSNRDVSSLLADKGKKLSDLVSSPWPIDDFIGSIYVAEDVNEALEIKNNLAVNESVITKDGLWFGKGWVRINKDKDSSKGVISREKEIKEVSDIIIAKEAIVERVEESLNIGRERIQELEERREEIQQQVNDNHRQLSAHSAKIGGKKMRLEQIQERIKRISSDIDESNQQIEINEKELKEANIRLATALAKSEEIDSQREEKENRREELRSKLSEVQIEVKNLRENSHKYALEIQAIKHAITSYERNIDRISEQLTSLSERKESLEKNLLEVDDQSDDLPATLEKLLSERVQVEDLLTSLRQSLSDVDQKIRESEQSRSQAEQQSHEIREKLEGLRINQQELKVHKQTYVDQMTETGQLFEEVDKELTQEATEEDWKQQLEEIIGKIQRLGSINLAAIEEYKEEYERKIYLDNQNADLEEALETLENAIKKIDRETRTRFKETFDKVNSGLQRMFPRLFGGGHGYLELTGADLLDTGVSVMARPPGKKISNIQLMSGGEKALTAVALVFAIFELNPAPFCMLDEVDAPLDEANVGRFGQLVKEMSETVQFIFITHNKATMEISSHLMGVTMHEPGVSRIVSVDVDEAVELTGAI